MGALCIKFDKREGAVVTEHRDKVYFCVFTASSLSFFEYTHPQ